MFSPQDRFTALLGLVYSNIYIYIYIYACTLAKFKMGTCEEGNIYFIQLEPLLLCTALPNNNKCCQLFALQTGRTQVSPIGSIRASAHVIVFILFNLCLVGRDVEPWDIVKAGAENGSIDMSSRSLFES